MHAKCKANVMVSSRGVAMIADFGNAQLKDFTLKFSNTTGFSTSLRWTVRIYSTNLIEINSPPQAPELLDGDGGRFPTKETDIYACGMVRLQLLGALLSLTRRAKLDYAGTFHSLRNNLRLVTV